MGHKWTIPSLALLLLLFTAGHTSALPAIYDADNDVRFIDLGSEVLAIDYLGIWDNRVLGSGTDYPYGHIWIILYQPEPYESRDLIEENTWNRSYEIDRFEIPGPSRDGLWENNDEVAFRNLGIHDWHEGETDRIVFRIVVEEPAIDTPTETLTWGTIHEDDTYTALQFANANLEILFRTLALPETFLRPSVSFEDAWFEHNVKMGMHTGLEVHVRFQVDNLRSYPCRLAAFVHYIENDNPVECRMQDPLYRTPNGNITIQEDFMPYYTSTIFDDFDMFIPYEAFPPSDDYVDYYMIIEVMDADRLVIASLRSRVFSVRSPE